MHFLVSEQGELLKLSLLLHRHERVEADATSEALVLLLLEGEEVSKIFSVSWGGCCSSAILDTQVPDLVDLISSEVEWVEAARHLR